MTLTEFLPARIAEIEALMLAIPDDEPRDDYWESEFGHWSFNGTEEPYLSAVLAVKPSDVLAECEAKRRIVERAGAFREPSDESAIWDRWDQGWAAAMEGALKILALPYAGHPDYDESWRP